MLFRSTESVSRNPDAMALLTKLQEKNKEILSRSAEIAVTMTIFGRFLQLAPETLELLGMIQVPGQLGPGHHIATDSKGNLYIAQTAAGLQKLVFKGMAPSVR